MFLGYWGPPTVRSFLIENLLETIDFPMTDGVSCEWGFPQMRVPHPIIHFCFGFSLMNHPFWGEPPFMETKFSLTQMLHVWNNYLLTFTHKVWFEVATVPRVAPDRSTLAGFRSFPAGSHTLRCALNWYALVHLQCLRGPSLVIFPGLSSCTSLLSLPWCSGLHLGQVHRPCV